MNVKVVALITRKSGLDAASFLLLWQHANPPRVAKIPGLLRYRQTPASHKLRQSSRHDGMAELWFDSFESLRAGLNSPEAAALRRHEKTFIESIDWFIADTELDFSTVPAR